MRLTLLVICLFLSACASKNWGEYEIPTATNIKQFKDDDELLEFIKTTNEFGEILRNSREQIQTFSASGLSSSSALQEIIVTATKRTEADDSITNNQEQGVDQGDIVKRLGDYIIVLRQGVLYSAFIGNENTPNLRLISRVDVQANGESHDSWYDELLVKDNTLLVVGYSYELNGAELVFFNLDNNGTISFHQRYVLESDDYFSGENSATRMINDTLVMVMPEYLSTAQLQSNIEQGSHAQLNAQLFHSGSTTPQQINLINKRDWVRSGQFSDQHMSITNTMQCSLKSIESGQLSCDVVSLIGARGEFYVSPNAVYVWDANSPLGIDYSAISNYDYRQLSNAGRLTHWRYNSRLPGLIYRINLSDLTVGAVVVNGAPLNQFSFKESGGFFSGLATGNLPNEDRPSDLSNTGSQRALFGLRFDIAQFDASSPVLSDDSYRLLSDVNVNVSANRFVGDTAFIASFNYSSTKTDVLIWDMPNDNLSEFSAEYSISAFHPLGSNMLAMGFSYTDDHESDTNNSLVLESWQIEPTPRSVHLKHYPNYASIERRSVGFNSRNLGSNHLFGVPIVQFSSQEQLEQHFWGDKKLPLDISFFATNTDGTFEETGILNGNRLAVQNNDDCDVSCYDWYGVARPFFINEHVYALIDYELLQGEYRDEKMRTLQRLNLKTGSLEFQ